MIHVYPLHIYSYNFFSLPPSTKNVLDSLENDELIYISVNGLLCVVCVSFPSILKSECVCGVCCVRVHSMRGWLTFSLICSHRWMNEMNGMLLFGRIIFFRTNAHRVSNYCICCVYEAPSTHAIIFHSLSTSLHLFIVNSLETWIEHKQKYDVEMPIAGIGPITAKIRMILFSTDKMAIDFVQSLGSIY